MRGILSKFVVLNAAKTGVSSDRQMIAADHLSDRSG
jgi:hypothetical protein